MSGDEIIKALADFGFRVEYQKGSHVRLERKVAGITEILTVPNHREVDKGTTKSIFNQASNFIGKSQLKKYFFTD